MIWVKIDTNCFSTGTLLKMCQIVNVVDLIYFSKDIYPATGAKRDMQVYTTKPNTTPTCTFDTKQNQLLKPKANNSDNSLIVGRNFVTMAVTCS